MTVERKRVYIASPYTAPDPCANTHNAMKVWDQLWDAGVCPFCPHWTHFQHTFAPRPYGDWLAFDLEWLRVCHAVLRLPGDSSGADKEVGEAIDLGIPVFFGVGEVVRWAGGAR
jgi:hypothetical protein